MRLPHAFEHHSRRGCVLTNYLLQTFTGLGTSAYLLSEGVWNAAANLLSLNIPGAITTMLTAVQNAGQVALETGQYVLSGVVTRATAVFNAVVGLVPNVASAVVGQVTALVGSVVKVVTDTFAALGSANPIQNTWNAVVDGLLGPTGIPGVLNALTIGYGIDPAPPQVPAFVPSIRDGTDHCRPGRGGRIGDQQPGTVTRCGDIGCSQALCCSQACRCGKTGCGCRGE